MSAKIFRLSGAFRLADVMTMNAKVVATSIFVVVFLNVSNAQVAEDSALLSSRVKAYQTAWNTHEPSALATFFTEDADMIMGNGSIIQKREAIKDWWEAYFARNEPERRITIDVYSIGFITSNVALINVVTTTSGWNSVGRELPTKLARGTWVLVRLADEWFISAMRGMPTENDRIIRTSDNDQSEANKVLARKWFDEVINNRNLDAIAEFYAEDYVYHGTKGLVMHGLEEVRNFAASILNASNDRLAVIEQQIAEGDLVVTRFTSSGSHTGTFRGKEPTGEIWITEGIVISRIKDGKIVEDWEIIHNSGL